MFVFDNVLTAGTVLVRQQIESQNWESSGHTAGWFIGADGSATFNGVTVHGDIQSANFVHNTAGYKLTYATGDAEFNSITIRNGAVIGGTITGGAVSGGTVTGTAVSGGTVTGTAVSGGTQSGTTTTGGTNTATNYVPSTTGYKLDGVTGSIEANNLTARGTLHVGPTTGQRLDLKVTTAIPRMELWSGDASEVSPAFVATDDSNVGFPALRLDSVDVGQGVTELQVISPDPSGNNPGEIFIGGTNSTPTGIPATIVNLADATILFSNNVHDVSLTSVNHAFQIGPTAGPNLAMDNNEIMARNNGTASTLILNQDGGNVTVGGGGGGNALISGSSTGLHMTLNNNQLWALNNAAASTLYLNFSGGGTVQIGDGTAAGADYLCTAMQPVKNNFVGPGGTIVSTTPVSSNALGTTYTNISASGRIRIDFSGRMAIVTGASAQRAFMGIQVQQTNSAGAVVYATTDTESVEVGLPASISGNAGIYTLGRSVYVSGLTPGSTYFIVITNRVTAGTTSVTVTNAQILVTPMP